MVVHYLFFLQAVNFLRNTKTEIIQLKVSYSTGNRYMDVTKWGAVGFTGLRSCLRVPERLCICRVLISEHRKETNRTNKTDSECTKLFIVKFLRKINESLS